MVNTENTTGCRYDHYATLCELLPVGLPSLRCCLAVLANKGKVTYKNSTFCEIVPAIMVCCITFLRVFSSRKVGCISSADQWAKNQRATHQPTFFENSINLLTFNRNQKHCQL
jgi:hypothetical protein